MAARGTVLDYDDLQPFLVERLEHRVAPIDGDEPVFGEISSAIARDLAPSCPSRAQPLVPDGRRATVHPAKSGRATMVATALTSSTGPYANSLRRLRGG